MPGEDGRPGPPGPDYVPCGNDCGNNPEVTQGAVGDTGEPGRKGLPGNKGYQGLPGEDNFTKGARGRPGSPGDVGPDGQRGFTNSYGFLAVFHSQVMIVSISIIILE